MEGFVELVCLEEITADDVERVLINELLFFRKEIRVRSLFIFMRLGVLI